MGWFDHHHYWRPAMETNTVTEHDTGKTTGALILEKCSCGAVRTIELAPGKAPVIRMGAQP